MNKRIEEIKENTKNKYYEYDDDFGSYKDHQEDIEYLLNKLDKYEKALKDIQKKSQILASHCAYTMDRGWNLSVHDMFEKTQALYDISQESLKEEG